MEEVICPKPKHVRRSVEIRQTIRSLASAASWPVYLLVAAVFALTAVMIPMTALLDVRVWNAPLADYLLYAAFLLIAPAAVLDKWIAKRIAPGTRSVMFVKAPSVETSWQWHALAAGIAALVSYLVTRGDPATWLLDFSLWFGGIDSMVEALNNGDLRYLSSSVVFISMSVVYTPPFPRSNHSRTFCVLLALFVAVAEAGITWWAWRKWEKDRMNWFDLDAT